MKLKHAMLVFALGGCVSAGQLSSVPVAQGESATTTSGDRPTCTSEVYRWPTIRREVRTALPPGSPMGRHQVKMAVFISRDGQVTGVQVVARAGAPFDDVAKRAMVQFLFDPGRGRDGQPLACEITYRYTFY